MPLCYSDHFNNLDFSLTKNCENLNNVEAGRWVTAQKRTTVHRVQNITSLGGSRARDSA